MKIRIEERESGIRKTDKFAADMVDLPGLPELGFGQTKEEAVANLFRAVLYSKSYSDIVVKMCKIREDDPLEIEYR